MGKTGGLKTMKKYTDYILEQLQKLLSIDSPTGYTKNVTDYLMDEYKAMGYLPTQTVKGGVLVDLGGKNADNAVFLEAHVDTLGAIVTEVKANGRLAISPLGGMKLIMQKEKTVKLSHVFPAPMKVPANYAMPLYT